MDQKTLNEEVSSSNPTSLSESAMSSEQIDTTTVAPLKEAGTGAVPASPAVVPSDAANERATDPSELRTADAMPAAGSDTLASVTDAPSPESASVASEATNDRGPDNAELSPSVPVATEDPANLTNIPAETNRSSCEASDEAANIDATVTSPETSANAPTTASSAHASDNPELWTPGVEPAGTPEESSSPDTVRSGTLHPDASAEKKKSCSEPSPAPASSPAIATSDALDESPTPLPLSTTETAENLKTVLEGICDMVAQNPNSDPKLSQYLKIFRQKFYSFINSLMPNHATDTAVAPSQTTDRVDNKEERKRLAQEAYVCWCRSVQDRVAGLSARFADITMKVGVSGKSDIVLPDVADLGCVFKPLTNNRKINVTISTESNKTMLCISGTPSDHLPTPSVPLLEICFEPDSDRLLKDYEVIRSIRPQPRSGFLEQVSAPWTLTIRPDPRLMWRSIPFDEGSIYYKPDADSDWCEAPDGFRVLAGSQKGRSHWHVGSARDDDFAVDYQHGWNFLAVADGAGSRQFSRQGSKLACQFAADRIFSLITPELEAQAQAFVRAPNDTNAYVTFKRSIYGTLVQTIFDAKTLIEKEANQSNHKPGDFATTMLCALVKKFDEGWCIASFMVGDGAMALYDARHGVRVLGDPDEGEYGGQTVFITMSEVWEDPNKLMNRVRVTAEPDFTALFLMTDGVSDPKFETTNQLANKDRWKALYDELRPEILSEPNAPKAAERLACEWLTFYSEGNHDDRTLVVMHRPEEK